MRKNEEKGAKSDSRCSANDRLPVTGRPTLRLFWGKMFRFTTVETDVDSAKGEVTELLVRFREGDREAEAELIPLVYKELRRLASRHLNRERGDHTLEPTALVHEAFLRLVTDNQPEWGIVLTFLA